MAGATRVAKFLWREGCCFTVDGVGIGDEFGASSRREDVIIGFDDVEQRLLGVSNELSRSI